MLKIKNLSKSFNKQKILKNINLEIEENTIIGLAGPSGGGKSTLLRCLQKLDLPDEGEIICDATVGFMFQDFQLFPHMTVIENITYAPKHHQIDSFENIETKAQNLLNRLGINGKSDFYPSQLSGGQKQRVALARILMMEPKLLLCDEPTSGLDISTIKDVINLLKEIKNNLKITMIIASHDIDFLKQVTDRVVLLKNGEIKVDINSKSFSNEFINLSEYY